MSAYETMKLQLSRISDDTAHLIDDAEKITELIDDGFSQWKTTCQIISEQISEEIMRVAVVGAIKSGKSTLVNTLFGGDYLKRGAGVVTSIVTDPQYLTGPYATTTQFKKIPDGQGWDPTPCRADQAR